jgi:hypothetical protein
VLPPILFLLAITPDELPYSIDRVNLIVFFSVILGGLTLIDYSSNPDPARINIIPNTVASCVLSAVAFMNMRYLRDTVAVSPKHHPMFIISTGVFIYYIASIFFFSQAENVLRGSTEALMVFMIINKAFYAVALIGPITYGFIKLRWN